MGKKMYVGIDMGTNSVGMAVTDENYNLYRVKGKDFWCSRLFDKADTAAERRMNRISRRRRQREVARQGILRELFADEINRVDPNFYARLDESKYHFEDRDTNQKYTIFADDGYTDKEYFKEYPTIFHLRKELLESNKDKYDVRLVYLAISNMFKHRGNFLNENLDVEKISSNADEIYQELVDEAAMYEIEFPIDIDAEKLISLTGEKELSRSKRLESVSSFLEITKKEKQAYEILKLACGLSGTLLNIYGENVITEDNKKVSINFSNGKYEEDEAKAIEILGDEYFALIEIIKELHDIAVLSNISNGEKYLSVARVELYNKHNSDLDLLQKVIRKYDKNEYEQMFRVMKDGNYSAYVGSVNSHGKVIRRNGGKGRSRDDFYKYVKNVLKKFPADDKDVASILLKIENETFMPKQLTSENGIIPNQLHLAELKAILDNAEKYLPFLLETDEYGLSVSQRIVELFKFHIPYYVGPLGGKGENTWAKRREGEEKGRIYPWNFEQKIDTKEAAEEFIGRMVRHCTYLSGERSLPKQSLLYEKFMVLNELNNLRIDGVKPDVSVKQDIYENVFLKGKKVTLNSLKSYLYNNSIIATKDVEITGIEDDFKASLSSVGKFIGVLGEDWNTDENQKMIENIIFWGTVYGNDKKFFHEKINEHYGNKLSKEQIKRISGFKFSGWGNLSKRFLELPGVCECGSCSLIQALWNTNHNLMELLSIQYGYKDSLDKLTVNTEKLLNEWSIDDLDGNYLSPSVKRMVWQTIKMLREACELTGREPDKVFVEMPREDGEKDVRKASRKKKLLDLYMSIKSEDKLWAEQVINEIDARGEADYRIKKLYLYYLQQGKCMYSGESIDLEKLLSSNNSYDIDHIYPRHFIKDDSLDNNLVLVKKQINNRKSDTFPIEKEIRNNMGQFWKKLCKQGFITKEKYNRLMRTEEFTDEEKAAFINRQLVETRQGTKAITQVLKQAFPDTQVVFVKAKLVSDFRNKFGIEKVRSLNDTHHAKDAYLNIVVGNAYNTKFTNNPINFIRDTAKNQKSDAYKYHMDKIFDYNIARNGEDAWVADNGKSKQHVSDVVERNTVTIGRKTEEVHGALSNKATVWGKEVASGNPDAYMSVKTTDKRAQDVTKYGGITAIANSGYTFVEYRVKDKTIRSLEALPVYLGRSENLTNEKIEEYISEALKKEYKGKTVSEVKVCVKFIPQKSKIRIDGFNYYIGGKTGNSVYLNNAEPLYLAKEEEKYLKKIEKAIERSDYGEIDKLGQEIITSEKNIRLFGALCLKLGKKPYSYNRWNIYKTLNGKEELFAKLDIEKQCFIITQIISWINSSVQTVNLTDIKGKAHEGIETINKKLSECKEVVLIYQSVTGMYERELDLLAGLKR